MQQREGPFDNEDNLKGEYEDIEEIKVLKYTSEEFDAVFNYMKRKNTLDKFKTDFKLEDHFSEEVESKNKRQAVFKENYDLFKVLIDRSPTKLDKKFYLF